VIAGVRTSPSRTLIAGGLTVLSILLIGRGVPAWRSWVRDTRATAQELGHEVERARLVLARRSASSTALRQHAAALDSARSLLLDATTPATAAAELAALLSRAGEEASVRVVRVEVAADTAPSMLIQGLADFLWAIEGGPHLLRVRSLSVNQPEPAAGPDRAEALRFEVVVDARALGIRDSVR
jgi:hypothetical protein